MNFAKWKARLRKIAGRVKPASAWCGACWGLVMALALVALMFVAIEPSIRAWFPAVWGWLKEGSSGESVESNSATLRNVGLLLAGVLALWFALWRARIANRQAGTAERGLLNERYQKGAEMLGSTVLSVRVGAIHTLGKLAEDYPDQYYIQIMSLFFSFVRSPIKDQQIPVSYRTSPGVYQIREDVQLALNIIGSCRKHNIEKEGIGRRWNLTGADLRGANMAGINLSYVDLPESNLQNAYLVNAILNEAYLYRAILTNAYLNNVIGMTQSQLDKARAHQFRPPKLDGALDHNSGEQLVWSY